MTQQASDWQESEWLIAPDGTRAWVRGAFQSGDSKIKCPTCGSELRLRPGVLVSHPKLRFVIECGCREFVWLDRRTTLEDIGLKPLENTGEED